MLYSRFLLVIYEDEFTEYPYAFQVGKRHDRISICIKKKKICVEMGGAWVVGRWWGKIKEPG